MATTEQSRIEDRVLPAYHKVKQQVEEITHKTFEFHDKSEYPYDYRSPELRNSRAFIMPSEDDPESECVYIDDIDSLSPEHLTIVAAHEIAHLEFFAKGYRRLWSKTGDATENAFGKMVSTVLGDLLVDGYLLDKGVDAWQVLQEEFQQSFELISHGEWVPAHSDHRLQTASFITDGVCLLLHPCIPPDKKERWVVTMQNKFPEEARRIKRLSRRIREIGLQSAQSYERCLWLMVDRLWGDRRPFKLDSWR